MTPRASALLAALIIGLLAALCLPTAVTPASAAPIDDLKTQVAEAQRAADEATQRYADGQNRYEILSAQVAELEQQIRGGRTEASRLRELARRKAVSAYIGSDVDFYGGIIVDGDPLDSVRRERMLGPTKKREDDAAAQLNVVTDQLDEQRADAEARRSEQAAALEVMRSDEARLSAQLQAAQEAQATLVAELRKELEAAQAAAAAAEVARQARQQSPGGGGDGGSKGGGGGAPVSSDMICPIRGPVSFTDTFGAPRGTGSHQGVDLMSPAGTPNVAVVSGQVELKGGSVSGLGARLHGDNGTLYYYFHLSAYEGSPRHVQQGEVIGYVGNTGDASGGPTHTHFEVRPGGGAAVNPTPYVAAVC